MDDTILHDERRTVNGLALEPVLGPELDGGHRGRNRRLEQREHHVGLRTQPTLGSWPILALGWNPPAPGQGLNFYRDWDARSETTRRQMSRLAMQTLVEIYGLAPTERVGFELWLDDPKMSAKVLARLSGRVDD